MMGARGRDFPRHIIYISYLERQQYGAHVRTGTVPACAGRYQTCWAGENRPLLDQTQTSIVRGTEV